MFDISSQLEQVVDAGEICLGTMLHRHRVNFGRCFVYFYVLLSVESYFWMFVMCIYNVRSYQVKVDNLSQGRGIE